MISIIMSCYNAEKTVARAIQSILNQTYQDFELIIVNDCSTDNSEQIIRQFNDPRIKLINHSENRGAGLARRTAINNMSGDYMTFLDADDYLKEDCLETYINNIGDCDILSSGYICVNGDNIFEIIPDKELYEGKDRFKHNKQDTKRFMNMMLIKSSLWNNVTYSSRRYIEDTPTLVQIIYYANKIQMLNYAGYYYTQNPNSLIHSADIVKDTIYLALCSMDIYKFFKDKVEGLTPNAFIKEYNKVKELNTDLYKEEQIELDEFYKTEKAAQLNC